MAPTGKIVGIDHIDELVDLSKTNVMKHHAELLQNGTIQFVVGDGRLGYQLPHHRKYNAIHVGAAAETVPPQVCERGSLTLQLIEQLAPGGRMLIPVGCEGCGQKFMQIDKDSNGEACQIYDSKGIGAGDEEGHRPCHLRSSNKQGPSTEWRITHRLRVKLSVIKC